MSDTPDIGPDSRSRDDGTLAAQAILDALFEQSGGRSSVSREAKRV